MTDTDPKLPPSRWTPQAVIGLLCLVAATVLRRVLDDAAGRDVADGLMFLGGSLIGWAPALPPIKPPDGGKGGGTGSTTTGLLIGLVLGGLAMALPGCGTLEVTAKHSSGIVIKRGPPCDMSLWADGERQCGVRSETERCEVEIDGEARP